VADLIREEGVSASIPLAKRPAGARLLQWIGGGIGHVVCLKLDRLFRDAEDALRQTKAWDRAGIALHMVDMGGASMNTASAMGRMFLTLMAGCAELERNLVAERTASVLAHKKQQGKVYNHTPYGFQREGDRLVVAVDERPRSAARRRGRTPRPPRSRPPCGGAGPGRPGCLRCHRPGVRSRRPAALALRAHPAR